MAELTDQERRVLWRRVLETGPLVSPEARRLARLAGADAEPAEPEPGPGDVDAAA